MYGYKGKILDIDLSSGKIGVRENSEAQWRKYLGGSGLAARILYDEKVYNADPLQEDNVLVVMTGLLTGTMVPTACKTSFCAKSPLTGLWGESTVGGFWGTELKKTPYDGIILRGKAKKPVYLWIQDDQVELRDATGLWGLDTYAADEKLKEVHGDKIQVACIGPAGENLVKLASIMIGGIDGRAAGRTGMGAVMGSKNVKAIAVKGSTPSTLPVVADKERLRASIKEQVKIIKENVVGMATFGTAGGVPGAEANGDLPIRNWSLGSWEEGAAKTGGQYMAKTIQTGHYGCYACPIRCGKEVRVEMGQYKGTVSSGPEYETCAGFGGNLLNDDVHVIVAANDLCNRLGLDTISLSGTIAWAMECYEAGLLGPGDTGGLPVTWGNGEVILKLVEQTAYRQGLGAVLGEGVKAAAAKIGGLAQEFALETKGLEFAYHDPRAFTSMVAGYGTANRGACHLEALAYFSEQGFLPLTSIGFTKETDFHSTDGKGEMAALMQNYMETFNALGLCKFLTRGKTGPAVIAEWVSAAVGIDLSADELMKIGERNFNLKRLFNFKLGITRKDDTLPPRFLAHDRKTGRSAGSIPHQGKILIEYYKFRGWTEEGLPGVEKLKALGL